MKCEFVGGCDTNATWMGRLHVANPSEEQPEGETRKVAVCESHSWTWGALWGVWPIENDELTQDDLNILVQVIKKHAEVPAHYNAGWDTVVECFTNDEIAETLRAMHAYSPETAIKVFNGLADAWMERRAESDMLFSW